MKLTSHNLKSGCLAVSSGQSSINAILSTCSPFEAGFTLPCSFNKKECNSFKATPFFCLGELYFNLGDGPLQITNPHTHPPWTQKHSTRDHVAISKRAEKLTASCGKFHTSITCAQDQMEASSMELVVNLSSSAVQAPKATAIGMPTANALQVSDFQDAAIGV